MNLAPKNGNRSNCVMMWNAISGEGGRDAHPTMEPFDSAEQTGEVFAEEVQQET